jgi:hypothetical protein
MPHGQPAMAGNDSDVTEMAYAGKRTSYVRFIAVSGPIGGLFLA